MKKKATKASYKILKLKEDDFVIYSPIHGGKDKMKVEQLDNKIRNYWLLSNGTRLPGDFVPPATKIRSARGTDQGDFIDNIHGVLIVSEKANKVIEEAGADTDVQFFPFQLRDSRGKELLQQYYIANVHETIPCFDWKRSDYALFPGSGKIVYSSIHRIHIDTRDILPGCMLFRIRESPNFFVFRKDLVIMLQEAGCTNFNHVDMGSRLVDKGKPVK